VLTAGVTGMEGPRGPSDRASSIPEEGNPTVICRWEIVLPAALTSPTVTYIGNGACFAAFVICGLKYTHSCTFLRAHSESAKILDAELHKRQGTDGQRL